MSILSTLTSMKNAIVNQLSSIKTSLNNKKGEYMYYHSIAQIWGKYDETIIFYSSSFHIGFLFFRS